MNVRQRCSTGGQRTKGIGGTNGSVQMNGMDQAEWNCGTIRDEQRLFFGTPQGFNRANEQPVFRHMSGAAAMVQINDLDGTK